MSGGSYDYLYQKMNDGDSASFSYHQERLVADLEELAKDLANLNIPFRTCVRDDKGQLVRTAGQPWGAIERSFTPEERTLAVAGIGAAISAINRANQLISELGELLASLSPVAYEVEWWRSGDTDKHTCAFEIATWLKKKAGIP